MRLSILEHSSSSLCGRSRVAMTSVCPFARPNNSDDEAKTLAHDSTNDALQSPKCPFGYDSSSFKLGPFSCVLCRALLFDACRSAPCQHIFCRICISRFKDCPLCGVDIKGIEPDSKLQALVDSFIEGHARISRTVDTTTGQRQTPEQEREGEYEAQVAYEDVSLARGSFLIQHAMRAYQAQNLESAKARLELCVSDTNDILAKQGKTVGVCSQLGAVLGVLGDCLRSMGNVDGAISQYEESVKILSDIEDKDKDTEVVHALSVSLNKLGDLSYYAQDLNLARAYYKRSLEVRERALTDMCALSQQLLDVVISLAKVADVDRTLGDRLKALEGFQEAVKKLEGVSGNFENDENLETRRLSVLEFLHSQLKDIEKH